MKTMATEQDTGILDTKEAFDAPAPIETPEPAAPKKSRFSPTVKGAVLGAVAGSVLPVFGTFSGALIGGVAGKIYSRRCQSSKV